MSRLQPIAVPYHDGLRDVDRGRGPRALLAAAGASAIELPDAVDPGAPEAARVFGLARLLAGRVRTARAEGRLPLVLAGDCNSCLGTVAGCGTDDLGVVWLDAHPDFDTPESSASGSLDAMGLALLTGHGWRGLRETVPGLAPVDERKVVLVGVRAFGPGERERLRRSRIRSLEGAAFTAAALSAALADLRGRASRVYLHLDLDALDPSEGIANRYSADGGLTTAQLVAAIRAAFARFDVAAAAITAYDPAADADGRMARSGARVLETLAECARPGLTPGRV